jgi:arylsulfatase
MYGGMGRLTESSVVSIKNKSHAVTCEIVVPDGGGSGTIVAQGGRFGGWSVYLLPDGRPAYCYNLFGLERFKAIGEDPLPGGKQQVRLEFDYDGGGVGKGGKATLYVDGDGVASTRVDATVPAMFSADETTDLGTDTATGVTDDLDHKTVKFTGKVNWVQIDLAEAAVDEDHRISPEEQYRIAMARQ